MDSYVEEKRKQLRRHWEIVKKEPLTRQRLFPMRRDPTLAIVATIERLWTVDRYGKPARSYEVTVGRKTRSKPLLREAQWIAYMMVAQYKTDKAMAYDGSTCTNPWLDFCECRACRDQERRAS